jgi:uncharacterized protein YbaP (TraB family)
MNRIVAKIEKEITELEDLKSQISSICVLDDKKFKILIKCVEDEIESKKRDKASVEKYIDEVR